MSRLSPPSAGVPVEREEIKIEMLVAIGALPGLLVNPHAAGGQHVARSQSARALVVGLEQAPSDLELISIINDGQATSLLKALSVWTERQEGSSRKTARAEEVAADREAASRAAAAAANKAAAQRKADAAVASRAKATEAAKVSFTGLPKLYDLAQYFDWKFRLDS